MQIEKLNIKPAERISSLKPYFFVGLNRKIAALRAQGIDVIRIDMGSPDLPPQDFIIDTLIDSVHCPNNHGYSPNGGPLIFREAISNYYQNRFNVLLDPKKEVLGLIGSKEGVFNLSLALLNPSDYVLVPDPGYPVFKSSGIIAGAQIFILPLLQNNGFLPDIDCIPEKVARQAKIIWLNYPNNPTGAVASQDFFEKVITFAKKYGVIVAHDAPYMDVCYDGYSPPSILNVSGAIDVAVEFNSLSKTYNMAGWRLGMAVGNPHVIQILASYKSHSDNSHFLPIYEAGVAAINGDQNWIKDRNQIYQNRRDLIIRTLIKLGFSLEIPFATIYIWAHLPKFYKNSVSFCKCLLEETGVSITPGTIYGEYGEGYIRISLSTPTERIKEAMDRLLSWMK